MKHTMQAAMHASAQTTLIGMDAHSEKISLCVTRWSHGSDPVVVKEIATTLDAMETTYKSQKIPSGALTVLEASTNSFSIHARLEAIGQRAQVLSADTLAGQARPDRINDRIDARNLAFAYARGAARKVHVPSAQCRQWRDIFYGRRNAVKDSTRCSNRIWGFCSGHGFKLPNKAPAGKIESIKAEILAHSWTGEESFQINMLLEEYKHALATLAIYEKRIEHAVAASLQMTMLMQIPGIRFITSFALLAFIDDITRFANPKKLSSYIGLNPTVTSSGEKQCKRSLSRYGQRELKSLLIESAQSAMRSRTAADAAAKWARRKVYSGKDYNVAVCALARKLATRAWHILMGHPAPDRESEKTFRRKLSKLAAAIGREPLAALGHAKPVNYIEATCAKIYPKPPCASSPAEPASPEPSASTAPEEAPQAATI